MGFLGSLVCTLLCFLVNEVVPYNPWDFYARNPDLVWRPSARTVPPVRQPLGPSLPQSYPWAWVDASQPRALSPLTPVIVQCGEAQVVITVKRDLFGTGRLVQAADLSLGSAGCKHTSLDAATETVIFEVDLHECGSSLQMTPDSLIYSVSLYYNPSAGSNPVILRSSPAEVPIECHYPRQDNVSSKAIKPTWVPFSSTLAAEHRLAFSLRLMNDDWSAERPSNKYQLGDVMHIQADVSTENHMPLRLFVDTCVATQSPDRDATPRYALIDYKGCLVDGQSHDSSSTFLSPRSKQDTLQFRVDVFRFAREPQDLIYITCHLKITAVDQAPDPSNKACSFNKATNMWSPVEGTRDICSCCEAGNCGSIGGQLQRVHPSWRGSGRIFQRDVSSLHGASSKVEAEADVIMGPVFIPGAHKAGRIALPGAVEEPSPKLLLGVTLVAVIALASLTLGLLLACKKSSHSTA